MNKHLLHIRRLTLVLILSGFLNIFLFSIFIYSFIRERPPTPYCSLKPAGQEEQQSPLAIDLSNSEVLQVYGQLPYYQLIPKLENKLLVDNGYAVRDLALGCLVKFHHFDLSRALQGTEKPKQNRTISFGKGREIIVFRDLNEDQYDAIVRFSKTEKWPMTSQGLFLLLQEGNLDPSLVDAFFQTKEYMTAEMLFNRAETKVLKSEILKMLLDGSWDMLSSFAAQQHTLQDLSPPRRQSFILQYIDNDSEAAAYLLLKTDGTFASQKLDDDHVIKMLALLNDQTIESETFSLSLISSPRSDAVLKQATNRLYAYVGATAPEVAPKPKVTAPPPVVMPPKPVVVAPKPPTQKPVKQKVYTVQPGDSLWKIAKKNKTTINAIVQLNKIDEKATLKPGMTLIISN
jgi:LysM repeat protein